MGEYHKTPCPTCGTATVHTTTAGGEGAVTIDGEKVRRGDKIQVCDSCTAIVSTERPSAKKKAKPKAKAKPKRKPARSSSRSGSKTRRTGSAAAKGGRR